MPLPAFALAALPILKSLGLAAGTAAAATGGVLAANKIGKNISEKGVKNKQIAANNAQRKMQKKAGLAANKGNQAAPSQLGSTAIGPKGLKEQLFGTDDRVQQFANRTPEQMAAQNQLLQMALANLNKNQYDFAPIQQEATQQYERQTIPSIMERFKGGALNRALASSGKDLQTSLAALKSQHALGQQGLNQNLLQLGLAPQFENAFIGGQEGLLDPFKNLLKDPASYAALLGKLKEAYQGYQGGQAGNNAAADQGGEFGGNPELAAFANQGTNNAINQYLQQIQAGQTPAPLNKNLVGMGITNPTASYQQVNPVQKTTFNGKGFIAPQNKNLDALRALYPTAI